MIKSAKILMASAATVMFIGCGAGDTVDELTGSKSRNDVSSTSTVTLNMANDKSSFTISVQGSPALTSSHVGTSFQLTDNNDHKLLDEYLGYKGDITTTCQQESATSTTITYECVSKNNYTTIVGKPKDTTNNITLTIGDKYELNQEDFYIIRKETSLDSFEKKKIVDSFTL